MAALRRGDRAAFAELVDGWGPAMLRIARLHVPSHAVGEAGRRVDPPCRREEREPAVPPERFQGRGAERPGWWAAPPARWADPHEQLETREAHAVLQAAIAALPPRQRELLVLRDVLGLDAEEACSVAGVSDGNQRVLLHRARAKVRQALEDHFARVT